MNDAIYKFKRYEDSSLSYTGINKHAGEDVGLYDTVVSNYDYMYTLQQKSMSAPPVKSEDLPIKPYFSYETDELDEEEPEVKTAKQTAANKPFNIPVIKPIQQPQQIDIKKEVPKVDCSGVKVGTVLIHKVFGNGKVVNINGGRITVNFGDAEKVFHFQMQL